MLHWGVLILLHLESVEGDDTVWWKRFSWSHLMGEWTHVHKVVIWPLLRHTALPTALSMIAALCIQNLTGLASKLFVSSNFQSQSLSHMYDSTFVLPICVLMSLDSSHAAGMRFFGQLPANSGSGRWDIPDSSLWIPAARITLFSQLPVNWYSRNEILQTVFQFMQQAWTYLGSLWIHAAGIIFFSQLPLNSYLRHEIIWAVFEFVLQSWDSLDNLWNQAWGFSGNLFSPGIRLFILLLELMQKEWASFKQLWICTAGRENFRLLSVNSGRR